MNGWLCPIAVADIGGVPLRSKMLSISCSFFFLENVAKSYAGVPWSVAATSNGESWIHTWIGLIHLIGQKSFWKILGCPPVPRYFERMFGSDEVRSLGKLDHTLPLGSTRSIQAWYHVLSWVIMKAIEMSARTTKTNRLITGLCWRRIIEGPFTANENDSEIEKKSKSNQKSKRQTSK